MGRRSFEPPNNPRVLGWILKSMLLVVEGPPTSRMGLEHSDALVWEQMRKLFFGVEAESVCFGAVFDFGFDYMVREATRSG